MVDCLEWHPDEKNIFHIIEKATGTPIKIKYAGDPFFLFHHINAYEDGNFIVVDVIGYEDATVLDKYYMKKLRANEWSTDCLPKPMRFVIPLPTTDVVSINYI